MPLVPTILRSRLKPMLARWTHPVTAPAPNGTEQFAYKASTAWLADRSWLTPYADIIERDRKGDKPATRILDRRFHVVQFAGMVRSLPGSTAECGVFKGVGSGIICRTLEGTYKPGEKHLAFDSYQGLSAPTARDNMPGSDESYWKQGQLSCTLESVSRFLRPFPFAQCVQGWLPDSLRPFANHKFRLIHLDVDLYDPTRDCLQFFYPLAVPGAVLLFDDYGSTYCPGARAAIDEFFANKPEQVVELTTGQAFVVKLPGAQ